MRKEICLVIFFAFLLNVNNLIAQEIPTDSLEKLYARSEEALYKHDYKTSIEIATTLLEAASKAKDSYYQYNAYNLLGMNHQDANDTLRARKYYQKSLVRAKEIQNDTLIGWAYNNLGNMYSEDSANYQKGINYYNQSIEVFKNFDNTYDLLAPVLNIAWTYLDFEHYDKAYAYLEESERIFKQSTIEDYFEDIITSAQLNILWGMYYSGKNDPRAVQCFEEALEIAEEHALYLESADAYRKYADFLFKNQEYEKAYDALEQHIVYKDKVFELEKIEQVEAANAKFEISEYQRNLELVRSEQKFKDKVIKQTKQGVIILIVFAAILLVVLFILYRTNRTKKTLIDKLQEKNNELFKAKEEALRLSKLKTKFFSTVSHELRTPLYGVVGLTSLLLEDKELKKHEQDLKSLKFSADYLLALINDVLQMNKMESNLLKLENINFNLSELIDSIVKSFEFTRLQNKNKIHLSIDEKIPAFLFGDSIRLSQVLMNLTGNAMKFTENGDIWLSAKLLEKTPTHSTIFFEVKDNGVGIPIIKQSEIFEEFSQLKSSNYNYQGTGLGLSIVKRLLELFDSKIHLKSEEGKGACFYFTITFENANENQQKKMQGKRIFEKSLLVGKKILIVDDNKINRAVTKRILEKEKVDCDVCVDGKQAIKKVKTQDFDLVLMDVNMPVMNGLEATKEIRKFNKDIPIIALTAVEVGAMKEKIIESGMDDIIVKPYDIPQFFQSLLRSLNKT